MHIIRLRHPWQAAWRDQPTDDALAPLHSHTTHQFRAAHYSRQFHRPSGLHEQQPVTLILQPTAAVSLVLQLNELQPNASWPPSAHAPQAGSPATEAQPSCAEAADTVAISSILLNSQPLLLSAVSSGAQLMPHISVRIESTLQPFNLLEIVCGMAAGEIGNDETAAVQAADACAASPPALSEWAEVRLEIDD